MANGQHSYASLYQAYSDERPYYDRLVELVTAVLEDAIKTAGLTADVKGRSKEPASFATKAVMKGYADPLVEIGDKAGVRVTVIYERDVGRVEAIVRRIFHVVRRESKTDALAFNEFGYLGVHFDTTLKPAQVAGQNTDLAGRRVEIQIRTMVQSAWAEISHEQLYKPAAEVPDELKRQVHRLVALVELFDSEVTRFLTAANDTPGYREAQALVPLAGALLERFDIRVRPDRQLSLSMAAAIVPLFNMAAEEIYEQHLRRGLTNTMPSCAFNSKRRKYSTPIPCSYSRRPSLFLSASAPTRQDLGTPGPLTFPTCGTPRWLTPGALAESDKMGVA